MNREEQQTGDERVVHKRDRTRRDTNNGQVLRTNA